MLYVYMFCIAFLQIKDLINLKLMRSQLNELKYFEKDNIFRKY